MEKENKKGECGNTPRVGKVGDVKPGQGRGRGRGLGRRLGQRQE